MVIKVNRTYSKEISKTFNHKLRKKLVVLNVSGMSWEKKKDLVYTKLIKTFKEIPEGISFDKRKTKDIENNPDGLRIFVRCDWVEKNRFFDYKGKFQLGTLIESINRHIEGKEYFYRKSEC